MSVQPTQSGLPFRRRQFAAQSTPAQIKFDIAFGVVLPLICLILDPIVFRSSSLGPTLLGRYRVAAYAAVGLGMLSLSLSLFLKRPPAVLVGLLAGGAMFASLLGLFLLPMSVIGLAMLIGILGFTPFVTAFVFSRNMVRAFRSSLERKCRVVGPVLLGVALSCALPLAAQFCVKRSESLARRMVQSADPAVVNRGLVLLRLLRWVNPDGLIVAYLSESDPDNRSRLADAYRRLTGNDIEDDSWAIRD